MYQPLASITLKSGERVAAGVVLGPDAEWRERLASFLQHKGELWNWQNSELLRTSVGVEPRFYVLHRDGVPFSHVMTVEVAGVGLLGHVFTHPGDRGRGAAAQLLQRQMADLRLRGGRALYLSAAFDSPAYHLYRRLGFASVEPRSGVMAWSAQPLTQFESAWFAPGPVAIAPLAWRHWPLAPALFTGGFPGRVRNVGLGLLGRQTPEEQLLPPIRENAAAQAEGRPPAALVLEQAETGAVVGLASWRWDRWPGTCLVDVYCHPHFWSHAGALLDRLALPPAQRHLAWTEAAFEPKLNALTAAGFRAVATLPRWVAADAANREFHDVVALVRER